jgi:glycosyltransferase involved in cell wall biosynthesis
VKYLFVSQRFVLPMDTGGKIRTGKILEKLNELHDVTVISNVESPKDDPFFGQMQRMCARFIPIPWKEIRRYTPRFFFRLFLQMFSRYPVSVLNTCNAAMEEALENEVATEAYDVIVCDFVQSAKMFRRLDMRNVVLFQHNVESVIARRHMEQARNPLTRLFWWLQWVKMYRYEREQTTRFAGVIAVSENDQKDFERLYGARSVRTIPTGVDVEYFSPSVDSSAVPNSLVFCGSMDWLPNEDGILYFVDEILPEIAKRVPGVTLKVVGRRPTPLLQRLCQQHQNVELTGWVDDTRPHLAASRVFIVPLRIGGGTRLKIFEAMAMGMPIVSTSIGAEGLPVEDRQNIMLADTAQKFADATSRLLLDPDQATSLGARARAFVEANFDWKPVTKQFDRICGQAVASRSCN